MLLVNLRNLLVLEAFKVIPLELAMSRSLVCLFWVVLLECTTSSNISLGSKVQYGETKRVYLLVINKSVKVVVRYICPCRVLASGPKPEEAP